MPERRMVYQMNIHPTSEVHEYQWARWEWESDFGKTGIEVHRSRPGMPTFLTVNGTDQEKVRKVFADNLAQMRAEGGQL
jgi:hypothetical protein